MKYLRKTHNKKSKNLNKKTRKYLGGYSLNDAYNHANTLSTQFNNLHQNFKDSHKYFNDFLNHPNVQAGINNLHPDFQNHINNLSGHLNNLSGHLDNLSDVNNQFASNLQQFQQPLQQQQEQLQQEQLQQGGFFNTSNITSTLQNTKQRVNTSLNNRTQQFNTTKQKLNAVVNHPEVKQNFKDLSTHSYNTAKNGALLGVNVAAASPFSAAYRGYNTYSSAKKGFVSAKGLAKSVGNAYSSV